jgi:hypothetical protein
MARCQQNAVLLPPIASYRPRQFDPVKTPRHLSFATATRAIAFTLIEPRLRDKSGALEAALLPHEFHVCAQRS